MTGYVCDVNSTTGYQSSVILSPNFDFDSVDLHSEIKVGTLIQGKASSIGEKEVSHMGARCLPVPALPLTNIIPYSWFERFAKVKLQVPKIDHSTVAILPLLVCPGYSHHNVTEEVPASTILVQRRESAASCKGSTAEYLLKDETFYKNGKYRLNETHYYYELRPYLSSFRIYRTFSSRSYIVDEKGIVIQDSYSPAGIWSLRTTAYLVDLDVTDNTAYIKSILERGLKSAFKPGANQTLKYDRVDLLTKSTASALGNFSATDVNTLQYTTELSKAFSSLDDLSKLVAEPLSPSAWANAYLGWKWGTKQNVKDTYQIMRSAQRRFEKASLKRGLSGRGSSRTYYVNSFGVVDVEAHTKIVAYPKPGWAMGLVRQGLEWGVWPTFKNTVDFIPFSFVVNWFTNLSDVLESLDAQIYSEYIKPRYTTWSVKEMITVPISLLAPEIPFDIDVQFSSYVRNFALGVIPFSPRTPSLDLENPLAINAVDGGALLIQRLNK